jgi:hypothetical protein
MTSTKGKGKAKGEKDWKKGEEQEQKEAAEAPEEECEEEPEEFQESEKLPEDYRDLTRDDVTENPFGFLFSPLATQCFASRPVTEDQVTFSVGTSPAARLTKELFTGRGRIGGVSLVLRTRGCFSGRISWGRVGLNGAPGRRMRAMLSMRFGMGAEFTASRGRAGLFMSMTGATDTSTDAAYGTLVSRAATITLWVSSATGWARVAGRCNTRMEMCTSESGSRGSNSAAASSHGQTVAIIMWESFGTGR